VTVTCCATFQFAVVKVRLAGETVPSVRSLEANPIVTLAVGSFVRTTSKDAVPPASVVVRPEVGVTRIPPLRISIEFWKLISPAGTIKWSSKNSTQCNGLSAAVAVNVKVPGAAAVQG